MDEITVGAFAPPIGEAFIENDEGEVVPALKSIKRYLSIISDNDQIRLKLILTESGQIGKLTETGYHDGILGLMQEGQIDVCFNPLSLDTQRAPGYFTPVISEDRYYLISFRSKETAVGSVFSSLLSIGTIPILLSGLVVLIVEMALMKRWNRTSLITTIYHSWSTLFRQHLPNHTSWYCFVQMIILMMPMFIFNASFNTEAIIRNTDVKIETLRDIITFDKTPLFIEGLSAYDLFKAQVARDYRDVYKQAVSKRTDQMIEPGPIFALPAPISQITTIMPADLLSITKIVLPSSGLVGPDHEIYISEKPFHSSLKGMIISMNMSTRVKKRLNKITLRVSQSGIVKKCVADISTDYTLIVGFQITKFDIYKNALSQKFIDLDWKPLNLDEFKSTFYIYAVSSIVITVIHLIELSTRVIRITMK